MAALRGDISFRYLKQFFLVLYSTGVVLSIKIVILLFHWCCFVYQCCNFIFHWCVVVYQNCNFIFHWCWFAYQGCNCGFHWCCFVYQNCNFIFHWWCYVVYQGCNFFICFVYQDLIFFISLLLFFCPSWS